jgi:hypothetical protein
MKCFRMSLSIYLARFMPQRMLLLNAQLNARVVVLVDWCVSLLHEVAMNPIFFRSVLW